MSRPLDGVRVCVAYDCLFPLTLGGAERWYRVLTEELVAAGATVTYLTRPQWPTTPPEWPGVRVVGVGGRGDLYDAEGTRHVGPTLRYGLGVFAWLARRRREFDAVIVANFPFFSLLGARAALVGTPTPVFADFFEVWSLDYWIEYAGRRRGRVGATIQSLCIRVTRFAQVYVEENARRLSREGFRGDVALMPGLLPTGWVGREAVVSVPETPVVLFVGRQVKHKGVRELPDIATIVRSLSPSITMVVVGEGPERASVEEEVRRRGLEDVVRFAGAVTDEELSHLYATSSCTIVTSLREGYGLTVVESVSAGTPVVVAAHPENLATGLVVPDVNGVVVEPSAAGVARGVMEVIAAGEELRRRCAQWSRANVGELGMEQSARRFVERIASSRPS